MNSLTKNEFIRYKKLLNKKYRTQFNEFIIEGEHLIEEASKHSNLLKLIITSNVEYKSTKCKVVYTSYKNICALSTTKTPQEYVGICNILKTEKEIFSNKVLVMNKINDPGNLGTLIRTAFAFGFNDIIVEGVDIYNPKVIRSTQGSIFNVNVFNVSNLKETLLNLKQKQFKLIGSLLEGANDFNKVKINDEKIILILGNESNGIDEDIKKILDYKVYIPVKFESLNVAIAGGILLEKYSDK